MAQTNANLIRKIADLLRGPYQPNQYGDVILPFTILRRLDCILKSTEDDVLAEYKKSQATKVDPGVMLKAKFKLPFPRRERNPQQQAQHNSLAQFSASPACRTSS